MAKKKEVKPSKLEAEIARRIATKLEEFRGTGVEQAKVVIELDGKQTVLIGEMNYEFLRPRQ